MNTVRHVTYNLLNYGKPANPKVLSRLERVRETLNACNGLVFSVQEIHGRTPAEGTEVFQQLATDLDLRCMSTHPQTGDLVPVFDPGRGVRGVGVMWDPDIESVAGSMRIYDWGQLANGMALVRLMIEGVEVTVASTHWPPRFPHQREDEGVYISGEIRKAGTHGIVGADWNAIFASRRPDGEYYDPDPYASAPWQDSYIGKARRNPETGCGVARREAMHEMQEGGLFDPAELIQAPWFRTVGHWKNSELDKRIDGPMVTETVAVATRSITSLDTELARSASDHLPVILDIDLGRLTDCHG